VRQASGGSGDEGSESRMIVSVNHQRCPDAYTTIVVLGIKHRVNSEAKVDAPRKENAISEEELERIREQRRKR
jgi:hypothetical protein